MKNILVWRFGAGSTPEVSRGSRSSGGFFYNLLKYDHVDMSLERVSNDLLSARVAKPLEMCPNLIPYQVQGDHHPLGL